MKHIFKAWQSYQEGTKEATRRSIDEVGKKFMKSRLYKTNLRKEG
jgi:rubrerythrin